MLVLERIPETVVCSCANASNALHRTRVRARSICVTEFQLMICVRQTAASHFNERFQRSLPPKRRPRSLPLPLSRAGFLRFPPFPSPPYVRVTSPPLIQFQSFFFLYHTIDCVASVPVIRVVVSTFVSRSRSKGNVSRRVVGTSAVRRKKKREVDPEFSFDTRKLAGAGTFGCTTRTRKPIEERTTFEGTREPSQA